MDQVKEILRQAIKYRFWIAVGISLLFPVIAYVLGAGPVQAEAAKQTSDIQSAKKDVEQYANGVVYNRQYPPLIEAKTAEVAKDVRNSWQKLYERQAPLLTWPERVQERFSKWGRKWPEDEDASRVQFAIIDYVQSYPKYVTEVYNSFRPYDYEQGDQGGGVVAAPPESILLRPAPFKETELPDLGKVWAAQERLWIQRALLAVVADVNKTAKSWDAATVKQIKTVDVGSSTAQDQVSIVDAETLVEAEPITDPKAPPPAEPASSGGMEGMMMGPMSGQPEKLDTVFYIQTAAGAAAPYKIMPVEMVVLVEQDRIQDFLAALENSPMSIQVKEFSLARPSERVTKPEKGQNQGGYGGYGEGMMYNRMANMARGPVGGFGGMKAMMPGAYGQMGGATGGKGGVDKRSVDARKAKKETEKDESGKTKRPSAHDPYFNVVEVTVYGQVRFYNPPPPEPAPDMNASPGETAPEDAAKAKAEEPKEGEKPATAPAKEGESKDMKEGDAPAEGEKNADAEKKDESKKDDESKKGGESKNDDESKDKAGEARSDESATGKEAPTPKADEAEKKDAGAPASKK